MADDDSSLPSLESIPHLADAESASTAPKAGGYGSSLARKKRSRIDRIQSEDDEDFSYVDGVGPDSYYAPAAGSPSSESSDAGAQSIPIGKSGEKQQEQAPKRYIKKRRGNWSYPDPEFNNDEQIIGDWKVLEQMISDYVDDMLVTHIPNIDTARDAYPYEALCRHSDLAGPIVRNAKYAKYLFQLSIWNILNCKYLGHMATEWACEERGTSWVKQTTRGLGQVLFRLTADKVINRQTVMAQRQHEKFYVWRKDCVDIAYGWLETDGDWLKNVESTVFDILTLYQKHFRAPLTDGSPESWKDINSATTELVAMAAELAIMMRRSRNGTWSPFIPVRGIKVVHAAIMRHQDIEASLPAGQTEVGEGARVTMTVVPGLSKYEMQEAPEDPAQPGVKMTKIVKRVRMRAKCLIDLTQDDVGKLKQRDIWEPEDL